MDLGKGNTRTGVAQFVKRGVGAARFGAQQFPSVELCAFFGKEKGQSASTGVLRNVYIRDWV
jgi:hypothetical protein